ncbi:MAG: serine--tRNA ligase [Phycisphaerales bacterium]|nr:serine--tRNA ligase [Phycisphaerales bacterium]
MIDLNDLRSNPDRYRRGAAAKQMSVDIDALLSVDARCRAVQTELQELTAEKNKLGREIGQLAGQLKKATPEAKAQLEAQMKALQERPTQIKEREAALAEQLLELEPQREALWLQVPQPPDEDVPVGSGAEDNRELRTWNPSWFDPRKTFQENKGFAPRTHLEIGEKMGLFDFARGVKIAGSRSYVLLGGGMKLHQAVLRFAFDFMVEKRGFTPVSVPVVVREEMMVGTGFFPAGREQAYLVAEKIRGEAQDLYLTGTGEVGLMALHQDEIVDADKLPIKYTTVSTCFRREAGAAGKDTAGLYRVHQFDKVEQVVICEADVEKSRQWHQDMIANTEALLQAMEIPYRLLQCCTGDLGVKNADMIDIESWMPGRGEPDAQGKPKGAYAETHSASRLYDYQCRRLNLRYRDPATKKTVVCHSLNNTVLASPRVLIPILELYQNEDGSVTVPKVLVPYMGGQTLIA